jgi:hypothetical protein
VTLIAWSYVLSTGVDGGLRVTLALGGLDGVVALRGGHVALAQMEVLRGLTGLLGRVGRRSGGRVAEPMVGGLRVVEGIGRRCQRAARTLHLGCLVADVVGDLLERRRCRRPGLRAELVVELLLELVAQRRHLVE